MIMGVSNMIMIIIIWSGDGQDSTQLYDPYPHPYKSQDDQDDLFPSGWALGQGTDPFGLPFLTVSRIENIFIFFDKFQLIVSSCITFLTVNRTQHYNVDIVIVDFCFTYLQRIFHKLFNKKFTDTILLPTKDLMDYLQIRFPNYDILCM